MKGVYDRLSKPDNGTKMPETEMFALGKDVFDFADRNKDGKVSKEELREMLGSFGEQKSDEDVSKMIGEQDTNKDGMIEWPESESFMRRAREGPSVPLSKDLIEKLSAIYEGVKSNPNFVITNDMRITIRSSFDFLD